MPCVAEHHSKQERERDDCPRGRIDFSVGSDSVRVDDVLVSLREFVEFEVGRRVSVVLVHDVHHGDDVRSRSVLKIKKIRFDFLREKELPTVPLVSAS